MSKKIKAAFERYVFNISSHYKKLILSNIELKDIIKQAENSACLPILINLVEKEFPQHKRNLHKYLLLK